MPKTKLSVVATALALSAAACGEDTPTSEEGAGVSTGPSSTVPGAGSGPSDAMPPGSTSGTPTADAPAANGGTSGTPGPSGPAGEGGSVVTPSPGSSGGSGGLGESGMGGSSSGVGGSVAAGGAAGNPAVAGSGGQSVGGQAPSGGGSAGDQPGAAGTAGSGPAPDPGVCPAEATFCSGFESAELPEGAVFKLNGDPATPWTALFEVDSTVSFAGNSSLRVRKNSEPNASTMYKVLAVPSGGADFWVRLYLRSDVELGQEGHNAYAIASVSDDPNDAAKVEFADDVGLSFNASDDVRWPEGFGRLTSGGTMPYSLPANEWHCIELHFDGAGRTQSLFVAGEELIVASNYPSSAISFATFKFGYLGYHNEVDRTVWYDDVVVAPARIGCAGP